MMSINDIKGFLLPFDVQCFIKMKKITRGFLSLRRCNFINLNSLSPDTFFSVANF